MLEKLHAEAIMHSPVEWAEKMDDILELVGP